MAGLQTDIYIASFITWPLAVTALGMRVIARRMTKMKWGAEDYLCVVAFVRLLSLYLSLLFLR